MRYLSIHFVVADAFVAFDKGEPQELQMRAAVEGRVQVGDSEADLEGRQAPEECADGGG